MQIGQEVFYYDSKNYTILSGTVSAISNTKITIQRSEHTSILINKNEVYETRGQAKEAKNHHISGILLKKHSLTNLIKEIVNHPDTQLSSEHMAICEYLADMNDNCKPFYFTYGPDEQFPHQDGWTTVLAPDRPSACGLFKLLHPSCYKNTINCSWIYNQEQFEQTTMHKQNKNFEKGCIEVLSMEHFVLKK